MEKVKLVDGPLDAGLLLNEVKKNSGIKECGAIVCFIGIVRGVGHDGSDVKELYYEADEENVPKALGEIRSQIIEENNNVKEIFIHHGVGTRRPGEEAVCIVAAGAHRQDAFQAAVQTIERVKRELPVWKKETTEKQSLWISEVKS